jgi:hypothetical protein
MRRSIGSATFLCAISVFAQSPDVTGWSDVKWATPKPAVAAALRHFGVHECSNTQPACREAPGIDVLVIDNYRLGGVPFRAKLLFSPKFGLSKVILIADDKRETIEKVLPDLTNRYGRPGLQSEYDGDEETLHTTWTWPKTHGTISMDSDENIGTLMITFEVRR